MPEATVEVRVTLPVDCWCKWVIMRMDCFTPHNQPHKLAFQPTRGNAFDEDALANKEDDQHRQ